MSCSRSDSSEPAAAVGRVHMLYAILICILIDMQYWYYMQYMLYAYWINWIVPFQMLYSEKFVFQNFSRMKMKIQLQSIISKKQSLHYENCYITLWKYIKMWQLLKMQWIYFCRTFYKKFLPYILQYIKFYVKQTISPLLTLKCRWAGL